MSRRPVGSGPSVAEGLVGRIVAVHEMLGSMRVLHQFGGAIALAWYRSPRATTDIDLNITVPPDGAAPVLGALEHLGVTVNAESRAAIQREGQARLDWAGSYLDVFFATLPLHLEMAARAREVDFGGAQIPILAPEHLMICKAVFARPKDWLDIEAMVTWGTDVDAGVVLGWVGEILGTDAGPYQRLAGILAPS